MVNSALHTQTNRPTDVVLPDSAPTTAASHPSYHRPESPCGRLDPATESFDIGSFELVRKFVEQVVAKNASTVLGSEPSSRHTIDWEELEASVADCCTLEQSVGRAVVLADQMCRGLFDQPERDDGPPPLGATDPFFAFSVVDVVPDFGDQSRYRSRVARRAAKILGLRRAAAAVPVG